MRRLPYVIDLSRRPYFPAGLAPDRHGIVAIGGKLASPVLLEAYSKGIFPWHDDPVPFWFSPDPRMVLYPQAHHVPERLRRLIGQKRFRVAFDTDFDGVIRGCATTPRPGQDGTWISEAFLRAYTDLHHEGFVHCVAVYLSERLVGGLYGVSLGRVFCGESMFSLVPNASKVAMHRLVAWCRSRSFAFVDCQVPTPHLASLGAVEVPRRRFLQELEAALAAPTLRGAWTEGASTLPEE